MSSLPIWCNPARPTQASRSTATTAAALAVERSPCASACTTRVGGGLMLGMLLRARPGSGSHRASCWRSESMPRLTLQLTQRHDPTGKWDGAPFADWRWRPNTQARARVPTEECGLAHTHSAEPAPGCRRRFSVPAGRSRADCLGGAPRPEPRGCRPALPPGVSPAGLSGGAYAVWVWPQEMVAKGSDPRLPGCKDVCPKGCLEAALLDQSAAPA